MEAREAERERRDWHTREAVKEMASLLYVIVDKTINVLPAVQSAL